MSIKWIFFDIGSTLVDETECYRCRIAQTIAGKDISYEEFCHTMLDYYYQGLKGDKSAAEYYGLKLAPWNSGLERLYPDAEASLAELSEKYNIGIIANQNFGTEQRLKDFGLMKYIDLVISSAEEGIEKPDRRIFYLALERAGCLPENAVMVGDRLDNDILPANGIGMTTVRIRRGFGQYAPLRSDVEKPDYTIDNLSELAGLF